MSVEYVVLVAVVGIAVMFATVALGQPLYDLFVAQQFWLTLPFP